MDEERLDRILQNFAINMSCVLERYPSLRDQFAMAALTGMTSQMNIGPENVLKSLGVDPLEAITRSAYAYADAMLAAREAGK